jgi:hypothetical protein
MDGDPRSLVEAPVKGALLGVMGRGIALVAMMAMLAAWPMLARPEDEVRDAVIIVAIGTLYGYAVWVRLGQRLRTRLSSEDRALAWDRAKEIDSDDATVGLLVAGWVPVALALVLVLHLWPNLTDEDPVRAAIWVVMAVPPAFVAWLLATLAWLDACRDDLARAEAEAQVRLRRYWSNVAH